MEKDIKLKDIDEVKKLLNLAIFAGELLIKNGAEIYRAEDTVQRMCEAATNTKFVDAYVVPSGIFVSLEFNDEIITTFKKVSTSSMNLYKIDKINTFSRRFVNEHITLEEGFKILRDIDSEPTLKDWQYSLVAGSSAAFFALLFGGNLYDFIAAFFVTTIMIWILYKLSIFKFTFFVTNFIGAFIVSFMAVMLTHMKIGHNSDMIIIASIMLLVPGVATTNAVRDIMNGDLLSGIMGLTKAIFIALAIALGVGVILKIFK